MRRILCVILVLLLAFSLYGCGKKDNIRVPVNFYYCTDPINYNSSDGVVSCEIRDAGGYESNQTQLLSLYLKGPVSDGFRSPFPANVQIEDLMQSNDSVRIILSNDFFQLTGRDQTLAHTCLSLTVMDLYQCETVQITSADLLNNDSYIEMNRGDFLFLDDYQKQSQP